MSRAQLFLCAVAILALTMNDAAVADYMNTPSSQLAYYHYPAPEKSQQLVATPQLHMQHVAMPQWQPSHQYQMQAQQQFQQQQQQFHQQQQQQYQQPQVQQQQQHVQRQFTSPSLERAAFTMALTSQGYVFGPSPAAVKSLANALDAASLNVRLPLPIGQTPLNNAPLPLQAGAPYDSLPHDVTSYGTTQPQRKR